VKKLLKIAAAACTASLLMTAAFADNEETKTDSDWYISPLGGFIQNDQSRGANRVDDNGAQTYLGLGKEFGNNFNLELGLEGNWLDGAGANSYLRQLGAELDAQYYFNRDSKFSPYLSAGVGLLETNSLDETNPTWGAGLGLLTDIGFKQAKLRTEVKFRQEVDNSEWAHDDVLLRAGVQIPFGAETKPLLKMKPRMEPKDSDGDGVMDSNDKCPATRAGIKVNSFGCELDSDKDGVVDSKDNCPNTPAGTRVNSTGCKLIEPLKDSDDDGVVDSADRCPNTPAGISVNAYGCELDPDDDNDGVANSRDQCPNTVSGVRVDFKGCEIKAVITLPGINFETNSATLTNASLSILNGAASTLNKYTDINAEVAGHTDSTGAAAYNKSLSERRATSVRDYLVSRGISSGRLTSRGYGEEQPIADNSNKAGRAQNRRVELKVRK